jgi:hypothetical protein
VKVVTWGSTGKKVDLMNNPLIGIIAEDDSDVDCLKIIIRKLLPKKTIGFKKFVGHGCGKINRKANAWAIQFQRLKCNSMIILHDCDRNDLVELKKKIYDAITPSPINKYFISIPVEELEAWLLSDPIAISELFDIKKKIKLPAHPETIESPKEFLEEFVWRETKKQHTYLNTQHNTKIIEKIDITSIGEKCPSFLDLSEFISSL